MQRALLSFLWPKNISVLRRITAESGTVVLSIDPYMAGVDLPAERFLSIYGLLTPEQGRDIEAEAAAVARKTMERIQGQGWTEFCRNHGFERAGECATIVDAALEKRIARQIRLIYALDAARSRYDVRLMLVSEDVTVFGRTGVEWARRNGIRTVHLEHSIFLITPYTVHTQLNSDIVALYGKRSAEAGLDANYPERSMCFTGNPAWDCYRQMRQERHATRTALVVKYGLSAELPIIVFGTASWPKMSANYAGSSIHRETLRAFLGAARELATAGRRWQFVVKDRCNNAVDGRAIFEELAATEGVPRELLFYVEEDTAAWVVGADVLVSVDSNLSAEAMVAGTLPAINVMNELWLRMGPAFEAESGVVDVPPAELAHSIALCVEDSKYRNALIEKLKSRAATYNPSDGQATDRVIQLIRTWM